jgi:hypothetical protein
MQERGGHQADEERAHRPRHQQRVGCKFTIMALTRDHAALRLGAITQCVPRPGL